MSTSQLKEEMYKNFSNFNYTCDSDIVCHKLLLGFKEGKDLAGAVRGVMESLDGAFSVTGILDDGTFFAFKDPNGIKPLCAGHSQDHQTVAFSSETVSLDMNSLERDFELLPGELISLQKTALSANKSSKSQSMPFALSNTLTLQGQTQGLTVNTFTKSVKLLEETSFMKTPIL